MRGLGARPDGTGTTFRVFSTVAQRVEVRLFDGRGAPLDTFALERSPEAEGLWTARREGVGPGSHYKLVVDGSEYPDPYARFLPFGVHGPARVLAPAREPPLAAEKLPPAHGWVIYELHVGTFTAEGTYAAAIAKLDDLVALGVNAIELMPLAAFPGGRGWGYDGVAAFAPFAPYGEPEDLRRLVREAHGRGLAVVLDVVYNHFGPDGNYLSCYAPEYFHEAASTPWGQAPSYDFAPMRGLVLDNAQYWFEEQGFDALRLDATPTIEDRSEPHILREVADLAHRLGRRVFFEDDRNDPAVVEVLGADGVWADDLHHQIHVLVTGERDGYYVAYEPTVKALAACIEAGWTYAGEPFAPWKGRPRGKPAGDLGREHLLTCIQNHDQVGNRAFGGRLSEQTGPELFAALAMLLLFLPTTPLLFMGQEWAATTPFLFFADHAGELGQAVSRGRREEFAAFAAFADEALRARIPDPQLASTFEASKLRWDERDEPRRANVLAVHRAVLRLRREDAVLSAPWAPGALAARAEGDRLRVTRRSGGAERVLLLNFGDASVPAPERATLVVSHPGAIVDGRLGPRAAVIA